MTSMTIDTKQESAMCSPARCETCGKTTWTGCGMHVDEVMAGVPSAQQCTCEDGRSRWT